MLYSRYQKIAPAFWKELSKDKTYDHILNDCTSYGIIEYDEFFQTLLMQIITLRVKNTCHIAKNYYSKVYMGRV